VRDQDRVVLLQQRRGTRLVLLALQRRRPNQFLFARIDRAQANLALLKFKLAEAERQLG